MNKLFTSIAVASLSLTMAVGVGVAVSTSAKAERVEAAEASSLSISSASTNTDGVLTAVMSKASGTSAPAAGDYGVRLYAKNTITITSSSNITSMTIPWTKNPKKDFANVTADVGSYTHPSAAGDGTWSGSSKSVVLTVGTGQIQLNSIGYTVETTTDPSITTATTDLNVGKGEDATFQIVTANLTTDFSVVSSDENYVTASYTPSHSDGTHTITVHGEEITSTTETITVSSGTASVTVNVNVVNNIIYHKVKSNSDIKVGRKVLIGKNDGTLVMGTYAGGNNIPALETTPNAGGNLESKDLPSGVTEFTIGGTSGAFTLAAGSDYLHDPNTSGKNYLYVDSTADTWAISVDNSGVATMQNVSSSKYVKNNGTMFACYSTGQTDIALFMAPTTDPAISVTVTSGSTSMVAGDTATLTAELLNGATGTVNWSKSNNNVTLSDETGLTTTVTSVASGSSTVTASLTNGSTVDPVDIIFTIRGGTADCPYTVAEALAAIDASEGLTDVYTTGIISRIGSFNSGKITYWISDDGTSTSELQVYKGLDLNQEQFTELSDLMIGDTVTVFGTLSKYSTSTYQYNDGNYLTAHSTADITVTSIDSITGTLDAVIGAESWDLSGLVVNGTLNSGSSQDITNYVTKTTSAVPGSAGTTTVDVVVTAKEGYGTATETIGVSATVREISGPIADGRYYIMNSDKNYGLTAVATDSKISVTDLTSSNSLLAFDLKLVDDNEYEITVTQNDTKYYLVSNTSAATGSNDNIRIKSSSFAQNYSHTWHLTSSSGTAGSFIINQNNTSSSTRYLAMYNSADWRGYANTEQDVDYEIQFVAEKSYAEAVADKILESCSSGGESEYDTTAWGEAKALYNAITISGEQDFLKNGHADKTSSDKIERALEKYDYAVARYKLTGADAFITDRVPGTLVPNSNLFVMNSEATTAIIVVVALTSVTAIGAIFFIKRRKYN